MSASPAPRRVPRHWILWSVTIVTFVFLILLFSISSKIVLEASREELRPADAIVVFGAAEYSGRPSPVYRARLDHAFELFQRGIAPVVITTGGSGSDPDYSEGGVGRDYLMRRGIPERSLIAETQGADGFWDEPRYTATGFPRVFYLRYHGYPKFFPLWALARYRNLRQADDRRVAYGM